MPKNKYEIYLLLDKIRNKHDRLSKNDHFLSIGIMGQVKAGKSTFLNALLFDGQPILPEAATPKTANLTQVGYGEAPCLTVQYYTPQEWQALTQQAKAEGQDTETKVARELVTQAAALGDEVAAKLALGSETVQATDISGLMGVLNQYAGENGRYTPLVKTTRLTLPLKELKGIEVVDTPGMNDPVQSRTQKTREYMARCDVVFFLSRSSQFLDQEDMELLARQLPGNGVKRMVLVACQLDSAILDDGYDRASLTECEANLNKRLNRRAFDTMGQLAEQRDAMGHPEVAKLLRTLQTPVLASTFAHGFGHWPQERWGKTMAHAHDGLVEMARDCWDGYRFTPVDWQRLSQFDTLKTCYSQAAAAKAAILQEQRDRLLPDFKQEAQRLLDEDIADNERKVHTLKTGDLGKLQQQQAEVARRIEGIAQHLQQEMGRQADTIEQQRRQVIEELKAAISQYSTLSTRTGYETYTDYVTISTSSWYNPFSWGSTETVACTRTRSYQYLAASDAIEQLASYGKSSAAELEQRFGELVSPDALKTGLRKSLLNHLDTRSQDFDPGQFKATLDRALREIDLPEFRIDLGDTSSLIGSGFPNEITSSSEQNVLRAAQARGLKALFERLEQRFTAEVATVLAQIRAVEHSLVELLSSSLHEDLARIEADFADRQQSIAQYETAIADAYRSKEKVADMTLADLQAMAV